MTVMCAWRNTVRHADPKWWRLWSLSDRKCNQKHAVDRRPPLAAKGRCHAGSVRQVTDAPRATPSTGQHVGQRVTAPSTARAIIPASWSADVVLADGGTV